MVSNSLSSAELMHSTQEESHPIKDDVLRNLSSNYTIPDGDRAEIEKLVWGSPRDPAGGAMCADGKGKIIVDNGVIFLGEDQYNGNSGNITKNQPDVELWKEIASSMSSNWHNFILEISNR